MSSEKQAGAQSPTLSDLVASPAALRSASTQHKRIALVLMTKLARLLSIRLRHANEELTLLQDN